MNKGFTLVELLAVILILSVLSLITVLSINPVLKDSKDGLSDIQIESIKESAAIYYIKHGVGIDDFELDNPKDCIDVSELIESGYIENDEVTNPKTGEKILGSVKVTYNANNYIYEYQDNACTNYDKGIICERVEETEVGNVPEGNFLAGDAYNCKVDPNEDPYKFYVLTTPEEDSDMVNLIMDQNIYSDGTPALMNGVTQSINSTQYSLVEWISDLDYGCEGTGCAQDNKGPVTAMNFLYNATKKWTNIVPLNYTYNDREYQAITENYGYTSFVSINGIATIKSLAATDVVIGSKKEPLRARMPIYTYKNSMEYGEVSDLKEDNSNAYLYENLDANESSAPSGYWTLSSGLGFFGGFAWIVFDSGMTFFNVSNEYNDYGVRPVISLYKFQLE